MEDRKMEPSYFSILTADVRYDEGLSPSEKIFYSEITALSNKYGYCTASNGYFARIYKVDDRTIRRWLSNLASRGYIKNIYDQDDGGQNNSHRKIYPLGGVGHGMSSPDKNVQEGGTKMSGEGGTKMSTRIIQDNNITRVNSTRGGGGSSSDFDRVMEAWNALDPVVPQIRALKAGTNRGRSLSARLSEYGLADVLRAIENIESSPFLLGQVGGFVVTFDWFVKPNNFIKVLEGNYMDKTASRPASYEAKPRPKVTEEEAEKYANDFMDSYFKRSKG